MDETVVFPKLDLPINKRMKEIYAERARYRATQQEEDQTLARAKQIEEQRLQAVSSPQDS